MLTFHDARVIDPLSGRDEITNVVVKDGLIEDVGEARRGNLIDAGGLVLAPGFVDLHVHFREPGGEVSETIETGSAAAAAGGFTAVFPMANTTPATDDLTKVEATRQRGVEAGRCDLFPIAALTRGLEGSEPTDIAGLAKAGVRIFSDDGIPVASASVMRTLLQTARTVGAVVCNHAQECTLAGTGQANEGSPAADVGLQAWPGVAESIMVARDVLLAEDTGAQLHVPHISTRSSVEVVRQAKRRGLPVTAEAAPHHFTLTDELVRKRDPVHKVNPPVRAADDVEAVREGLQDGTIDAIATDHAPHALNLKRQEWEQAPFGMLGLETSLGLTVTQLVDPGSIDLPRAVALLSTRPATIGGLADHGGPIVAGHPANLTLFDPDHRWVVNPSDFHSKSRNSPYEGYELRGKVIYTLVRGRFTYQDGSIVG